MVQSELILGENYYYCVNMPNRSVRNINELFYGTDCFEWSGLIFWTMTEMTFVLSNKRT